MVNTVTVSNPPLSPPSPIHLLTSPLNISHLSRHPFSHTIEYCSDPLHAINIDAIHLQKPYPIHRNEQNAAPLRKLNALVPSRSRPFELRASTVAPFETELVFGAELGEVGRPMPFGPVGVVLERVGERLGERRRGGGAEEVGEDRDGHVARSWLRCLTMLET